jgi:alkylation response protein AidB-like acyl-CoA dehydrogenase
MPFTRPSEAGAATLRAEVRDWVAGNLAPDWRRGLEGASEDEVVAFEMEWMRKVAGAGLAVPTLPAKYGGPGLSFEDNVVIIEEMARADTPSLDTFMVTRTHAPVTLLEWGTPEQQDRYLPGIGRGDLWCQGFSEPNAGSDLAALKTRAVRDGDAFVVNGQKVWSSFSRHARHCLLLVRTDPDAPKWKGISYFALDMNSPGVEVRPIRQATGNAEFSEIFLNDVRVPASNLLGPLNEGWTVAQSTLAAERGVLAFERVERLWHNFRRFIAAETRAAAAWLQDGQKLARAASLASALRAERRLIRCMLEDPGKAKDLAYPTIIKISHTELAQRLAEFLVEVRGIEGQIFERGYDQDYRVPMFDYIFTFGNTISAGTNEIMKNIIAERVLGMPR